MTDPLASIRAELDALDDDIHDRLMRRADAVARLAASAAKPAGTTLRPGREAAILRRLLARHHGPLPRGTVVRLWREVFASSVQQQAGFAVAVPPGEGLLALAAGHFGTATPLKPQPSLGAALSAVATRAAAAVLMPWPREGDDPWWQRLDGQSMQVVARLPFWSDATPPIEAALLALYPADESGADRVLFRVEAPPGDTRATLAARFPGARLLITARGEAATHALLEGDAAPEGAVTLGRYAIPERGAA